MSFATLDALRESLAMPAAKVRSPEYVAKMMHRVPEAGVVDRAKFILERCKGKVVLDIGASGPMHEQIAAAARDCFGIDRPGASDVTGVVGIDLDEPHDLSPELYEWEHVELVVCGEVLEHLSNPGRFLNGLRRNYPNAPVIITVPNAFSTAGQRHMEDGIENVNIDHVNWYSWRTMKTLLDRCGYVVEEFHWYGGEPYTAEGLIFLVHG